MTNTNLLHAFIIFFTKRYEKSPSIYQHVYITVHVMFCHRDRLDGKTTVYENVTKFKAPSLLLSV